MRMCLHLLPNQNNAIQIGLSASAGVIDGGEADRIVAKPACFVFAPVVDATDTIGDGAHIAVLFVLAAGFPVIAHEGRFIIAVSRKGERALGTVAVGGRPMTDQRLFCW